MKVESPLGRLIAASQRGDVDDAESLFAAMYAELHRLARRELARHDPRSTLGVTTLLHEAYLDVAGDASIRFPDRGRFMAYAARVMRGLIIDHLRERRAQKRGGRIEFTSTITDLVDQTVDRRDVGRIADALEELEGIEPALAEIVDLKFFCGFSFTEIAGIRGVSDRTVQRQWGKARLYLHRSLTGAETDDEGP